MLFNPIAVIVAALSTFVVGFIWYNPKVFGTIWMQESGITEEKAKQGNMIKIFGLTLLFSIMIAFMLPTFVIHQIGALQASGGNVTDEAYLAFMQVHGERFLSFKHGALHGFILGLFFVLPITAVNSLFEQKSWKYILITSGYWIVSLTIMGAIICGWH
ncbi:DUF1761 domain-containing protein [Flavobacterium sp. NRK F10]|uniref:DUF1761 domain-containing protein n=1 Tax=Flavobacterium sediminis TaxID=2201181 RepID=A0A2U8QVJ7_9FLAO|nr:MULTISPECIES: DUF1761 domain-containing protein [Flavobacterium]AWM14153.1 DUF1761 domain-containing protein [Flavobacterium sediminis]MCO6175349.1 DUF1761 domain-containing protein [Flavobacterium sp. NRK F10]